MRVLVVVNALDAPAGQVIARIAARGGVAVEIPAHAAGAKLPETFAAYDALVVLGGAQDAWDDTGFPAFAAIRALMRGFDAEDRPVLAICLGAQLLAQAHGAAVRRMTAGFERGLTPMRAVRPPPDVPDLIAAAGRDPILASWHRDSFDLPEGAHLLLSSAACTHQAFHVGRASFGFQCHIEATPEIVGGWIAKSRDRAAVEPLKDQLGPRFDAASRAGTAIIDAWLDLVAAARDRRTDG
jgi:GMP synthase (glutamine-hydrolysing)